MIYIAASRVEYNRNDISKIRHLLSDNNIIGSPIEANSCSDIEQVIVSGSVAT